MVNDQINNQIRQKILNLYFIAVLAKQREVKGSQFN